MAADVDVPEPEDASDDENLVHLIPAEPPLPTAMCCVYVYSELSGRIWYRFTANPDIGRIPVELSWVRGAAGDVIADVRAFLDDFGRSAPY